MVCGLDHISLFSNDNGRESVSAWLVAWLNYCKARATCQVKTTFVCFESRDRVHNLS